MDNMLLDHCSKINKLFEDLQLYDGRLEKERLVTKFKENNNNDIISDLNFCFEVLAGKHKVGFTYNVNPDTNERVRTKLTYNMSIKQFVYQILKDGDNSTDNIKLKELFTPYQIRPFICKLVNREFKLGYSNKDAMITHYSPMLAKKYQDTIKPEQMYYIQEKLDGNRCIACFNCDTAKWEFWSRSGKQLKVDFDMSWVNEWLEEWNYVYECPVFDGEIMTLKHAGSRDFNRTSGAINSKYLDKSGLHYFIYDIVAPSMTYEERKAVLDSCEKYSTMMLNTHILPVLDEITIYPNHDYNWKLDEWLDEITSKGGEGLILRDPNGYYTPGKRSDGLLKYKKTQTMDLRIVGWNEGNGKYEGAIGSFVCETDDKDIIVNVAGMSDDIRFSDPDEWINKIIEVAYFDISVNSTTSQKSLRFPRLKRVRDDKNTTSIY